VRALLAAPAIARGAQRLSPHRARAGEWRRRCLDARDGQFSIDFRPALSVRIGDARNDRRAAC
jgi:hypothetical protein